MEAIHVFPTLQEIRACMWEPMTFVRAAVTLFWLWMARGGFVRPVNSRRDLPDETAAEQPGW